MAQGKEQASPIIPANHDDNGYRVDVARLAHELRSPLGAIAALAEIMRDERLGTLGSPRYRAYAADIHHSAMHATSVITAFLDPDSERGTGSGPLEFVELDLGRLVEDGVSALAAVAEKWGVRLASHVPTGLPHVIADRRSILQILNNLVSNAIKYTPPGRDVEVTLAYDTNGPITLTIADRGDGMSEAELRRARGEGPSTEALRRRSSGTGIGLPLVRTLAAAGGATLTIEARAGEGTRVTVAFPHNRLVLA